MNTFKTLALAALVATSQAAFTCSSGDYITPIKGSDGVPPVIAAGPDFVSPSTSALITTNDDFHVMFESVMVANSSHDTWTRQLSFLVAAPDSTFADTAALATAIGSASAACKGSVSSGLSMAALEALVIEDGKSTCTPNFDFPLAWEAMRNADTGCGWNEDLTDPVNFIYTARVHVMWTDSDGNVEAYTRPAAMTYYPVSVSFQKAVNQTANDNSNNTVPYVADSFAVTGVSYVKTGSNVALKVAYTVSTYWPYLVMPNKGNAALSSGLPADAEALTVPYSYAGTYSITGAFASSTGCGLDPTSATTRPDDGICTFTQEVTYTWAYGSDSPNRCDAGSASDFSIGFATCVYSATNGATNEGCLDSKLQAQDTSTVGAFKISAGIDLCKAPANTYSVSVSSNLAALVGTVDVGKQVGFATTVTTSKQVKQVKVWESYVDDVTAAGKGGRWTLVSAGVAQAMATATGYADNAVDCLANDKLSCALTLAYTPNVGATDASNYMVILADRERAALTFTTFVRMRFYWDDVNVGNNNGGTGLRRLMYRDQTISSVAQTQDLAQSADVRVRVANTAATGEASSGLSTAAIAGIATAGVVLVATAGVIGALVYRKRRAVIIDAEKAVSSEKL